MKLIIVAYLLILSLSTYSMGDNDKESPKQDKIKEAIRTIEEHKNEIEQRRLKREEEKKEQENKAKNLKEAEYIISYVQLRDAIISENKEEIEKQWFIRYDLCRTIKNDQKKGFENFIKQLTGDYTEADENCWPYCKNYTKNELKKSLKSIFIKHNEVDGASTFLFTCAFISSALIVAFHDNSTQKFYGIAGMTGFGMPLITRLIKLLDYYINYDFALNNFMDKDNINYDNSKKIRKILNKLKD